MLSMIPLSGTCNRSDWEKSLRILSSSVSFSPVKDRDRKRYSMKPFTGGAVITKPAGLEESLDFEIFDKTSGSEALRP